MLHGTVNNVSVIDMQPANYAQLAEVRVSFVTDKAIVPDLLAALANEPYIALLGDDYEVLHKGKYAEIRSDA